MNPYDLEEQSELIQPPSPRLAHEGARCSRCGYALGGLPADAVCPECGHPIPLSLAGDRLAHAGPEFVRTLRVGAIVYLVAYIGSTIGGFTIAVVGGALSGSQPGLARMFEWLANASNGVFALLAVLGWWYLTKPDSGWSHDAEPRKSRIVARTAYALSGAFSFTAVLLLVAAPAALAWLADLAGLMSSIAGLTAYVGYFAGLIYLRRLAMRIPAPHIAATAKRMIALVVTQICLVGVMVIGFAAVMVAAGGGAGGGALGMGAGVVLLLLPGCAFGVLSLILLIYTIVLFSRLISVLGRVRDEAERLGALPG